MPIGQARPGIPTGPAVAPRLTNEGAGQTPTGSVWVPSDHTEDSGIAVFDASGVAQLALTPRGQGAMRVERLAISTDSSTDTTAAVYSGGVDPRNLVDLTQDGNGAIGDQINPILVSGNSSLTIRWSGGTPGAKAAAHIQYQLGTYRQGPVVG